MTDPGTTDGTTQTEGQTARDIFPEDDGIPEVAQDDSPTMQRAEDPQFEALPGDHATATTDFGTTAFEQAEGESLAGRWTASCPTTPWTSARPRTRSARTSSWSRTWTPTTRGPTGRATT